VCPFRILTFTAPPDGGYETLIALALSPGIFVCGVDLAGPASLVILIEAFPQDWAPVSSPAIAPLRWQSGATLRTYRPRTSLPLFLADRIRAPLFVFQGANDPRVRLDQSDQIVHALAARGIPVTYLVAGNEGHSIDDPQNSVAVSRAIDLFLAHHLGGQPQPKVAESGENAAIGLTVSTLAIALI
jgi:dipeptidyl aminopeptidase/acylaminoacyl peptidase